MSYVNGFGFGNGPATDVNRLVVKTEYLVEASIIDEADVYESTFSFNGGIHRVRTVISKMELKYGAPMAAHLIQRNVRSAIINALEFQ